MSFNHDHHASAAGQAAGRKAMFALGSTVSPAIGSEIGGCPPRLGLADHPSFNLVPGRGDAGQLVLSLERKAYVSSDCCGQGDWGRHRHHGAGLGALCSDRCWKRAQVGLVGSPLITRLAIVAGVSLVLARPVRLIELTTGAPLLTSGCFCGAIPHRRHASLDVPAGFAALRHRVSKSCRSTSDRCRLYAQQIGMVLAWTGRRISW